MGRLTRRYRLRRLRGAEWSQRPDMLVVEEPPEIRVGGRLYAVTMRTVDRILGGAVRSGKLPLRGHLRQVSGRASFELAQKAIMAGIPLLSAVSAPSSRAVGPAADRGLTRAGFVRENGMNVYAHPHRVIG